MKKVLLLSPLTKEHVGIETYGAPALGVHRIAAYLRTRGHQVEVYDSNLTPEPPEQKYKGRTFDIIGVSIFNPSLILSVQAITRLRKAFPDSFILAGGMEASFNYQIILDYSGADAVCLAEGETILEMLCEDNIPLERIPGLVVKTKAPAITNEQLWRYWETMDFSKMGYEEYWKQTETLMDKPNYEDIRTVRIVTSSHCNWGCSFCGACRYRELATGYRPKVAILTTEQIEILLHRIKKQVPEARTVYFIDENLLVTRKRGYELIPVMGKFEFTYLIQTMTWMLTEDLIRQFAKVGVRHITCGIESVSSRVRESLNKPQDNTKIKEVIKWCEKYGVHCYYLFMLFPPQITMEELILTYKTLTKWIEDGVGISVEPYIKPYYGTQLWDDIYDFHYEFYQVNGRQLKWPTMILPQDPEARKLMQRFRSGFPQYLTKASERDKRQHLFKGYTGEIAIEYLGKLLEEQKCGSL